MTEYKDLATMEANETKADNLAQTVIGSDDKQMQGYRERLQIREVLETRIAREQVLEPKRWEANYAFYTDRRNNEPSFHEWQQRKDLNWWKNW